MVASPLGPLAELSMLLHSESTSERLSSVSPSYTGNQETTVMMVDEIGPNKAHLHINNQIFSKG